MATKPLAMGVTSGMVDRMMIEQGWPLTHDFHRVTLTEYSIQAQIPMVKTGNILDLTTPDDTKETDQECRSH